MCNLFLRLIFTPKKVFEVVSENLLIPDLYSVQIREEKAGQYIYFIEYIQENMKDSMVNFITKEANGFIGSSAFSVCIDTRKNVRRAIIYKH